MATIGYIRRAQGSFESRRHRALQLGYPGTAAIDVSRLLAVFPEAGHVSVDLREAAVEKSCWCLRQLDHSRMLLHNG